MSDYDSIVEDVKQDINSLIERINKCDPSLCNEDWKEKTYGYDPGLIEFVYDHIDVEEMLDIITDLISKEFLRHYYEDKTVLDSSLYIDGVSGYPDLNIFQNQLESLADRRRTVLDARREEKEAREQYLKKLNGRKQKKQSSYILSGWGQQNTDGTGNEGSAVDSNQFWLDKTQDFDLTVIRDILKNHGSNVRQKMEIVRAIYEAAANTTNLSKLPYSVDKLLYNYRKNREIEVQNIIDAFYMPPEDVKVSFRIQKDEIMDQENINYLMAKMKKAFRQKMEKLEESDGETENDDDVIDIGNLPEEFKTPKARQMMQKLVDAEWLSDDWLPQDLSNAERGYLAFEIARRLEIDAKWKVMGQIWDANPETLRQAYNRALNQKKTQKFIERIKKLLG